MKMTIVYERRITATSTRKGKAEVEFTGSSAHCFEQVGQFVHANQPINVSAVRVESDATVIHPAITAQAFKQK